MEYFSISSLLSKDTKILDNKALNLYHVMELMGPVLSNLARMIARPAIVTKEEADHGQDYRD
jgi:hypothetical protein